tara:strand:+ start:199 stop:759 length:561 start_codon:yes stop_codon:yes gene_type:complete
MPSKYGFGDSRSKNAPVYKKSSGFKMKGSPMQRNFGIVSPMKNYKNPQDYKVFNMGNEPTPMKQEETGAIVSTGGVIESNIGLNSYDPVAIDENLQARAEAKAGKGKSPNKGKSPAKIAPMVVAALISAGVNLYSSHKNRKAQEAMMDAEQQRYDDELARFNEEKEKAEKASRTTSRNFKSNTWTG